MEKKSYEDHEIDFTLKASEMLIKYSEDLNAASEGVREKMRYPKGIARKVIQDPLASEELKAAANACLIEFKKDLTNNIAQPQSVENTPKKPVNRKKIMAL